VISPIVGLPGIGLFFGHGSVQGVVLPITPGRTPDGTVTLHTTPDQDQKILDYIRQRTNDPGDYNLFGRNCATFVHSALGAAGISSSSSPLPSDLLDTLTPHPDRPKPLAW
jgi:uncharacterized protein DUF4105